MRCGATGLRPTFGRVPRTGAMTLCWSLDKLGPMTRSVEDAMLVLQAVSGPDAGDVSSVPSRLEFDAAGSVKGLRVGYFPAWMKESPATDVDRAAFAERVRRSGWSPPKSRFLTGRTVRSSTCFCRGGRRVRGTHAQRRREYVEGPGPRRVAEPVPSLALSVGGRFRSGRRLRRKVAIEMARIFSRVDLLLVPSLRDEMLTLSNFTGHPSLTLRAGFVSVSEARSNWALDRRIRCRSSRRHAACRTA